MHIVSRRSLRHYALYLRVTALQAEGQTYLIVNESSCREQRQCLTLTIITHNGSLPS
jgi:hypothetical protein